MENSKNYYNVTKNTGKIFTELRVFSYAKHLSFDSRSNYLKTKDYEINKLSRIKSNHRAKKNIIDLINNNFYGKNASFITLTFRDNVEDLNYANKSFKRFIRKIRNYLSYEFKYIAVIEFQKRGSIHYHLVSNIFNIDYAILVEFWNKSINSDNLSNKSAGYIRVNKIFYYEGKSRVSFYISKYMSKSLFNPALFGKKCYFTSRNLYRSVSNRYLIKEAFHSNVFKKLKINGKIQLSSVYYDAYSGHQIQYYLIKNK